MKKLKFKKIQDVFKRAIKTFLQGFLASLGVYATTTDFSDITVLKSVLIGCIAGGLSALTNLINNMLSKEE